MQTFFQDLWATLRIAHSNFNARYGALFNILVCSVIAAAVLIALVRAIAAGRRGKKSASPLAARTPDPALTQRAAESLAQALQIPSVTGDKRQLAALGRFLRERYPRCMETMDCADLPGGSILLRWSAGEDSGLEPALFCGHLDVVPGGDGWTVCEPFDGLRENGRIYGRGAMDCKGVIIALMEAAEALIAQGYAPRRDLYFAFGCDEETGGEQGARAIAHSMAAQGLKFDLVLDEGGAIYDKALSRGRSHSAAYVGMAEKRQCDLRVTVSCPGGHTSAPRRSTALGVLSEAVCRIATAQPHHRLSPIVRNYLDDNIATFSFGKRFVVANRVLMNLFVTRAFRDDPEVLALVRSTIVPTMVDGSFPAKNILPSTARAFFNARLLPGDTPEKLLKYVKELLADLPVEVELLYAGEESFTTSRKTPMYRLLRSTLEELYPQLPCIPTLMTMSSDARHYSDLSDCILRFAPLTLGKEGGGGTHGPDEFISEQSLGLAAEFYQALIRKL